jgi:hypothetical protein
MFDRAYNAERFGTFAPLEDVLAADVIDRSDRSSALAEVLNFVEAAERAFAWGRPQTQRMPGASGPFTSPLEVEVGAVKMHDSYHCVRVRSSRPDSPT